MLLSIEFIPTDTNKISFKEKKLFLLIDNTEKSALQLKAFVNDKGEKYSLLSFKESYIEYNTKTLLIFEMQSRPQLLIIDIGEFEALFKIRSANEISYNAILRRKKQ